MTRRIGIVVALWLASATAAAAAPEPSVEFGKVPWLRNYDEAVAQAKASGKPILVLFDEVPGCATCRQFGQVVLSHPIAVDAAASEFVAVAIRNNAPGGHDAEVLKKFKQPAWANPEVRLLDAAGRDLVPRAPNDWTLGGLFSRMVAALQAAGRPVPAYLKLADAEHNVAKRQSACFAMFCYWQGEKAIGRIDGVVATRIGALNRREVVECDFDAAVIPFETLLDIARASCGSSFAVMARTPQQAEAAKAAGAKVERAEGPVDTRTRQKVHLAGRPEYQWLPLTEAQAARVNGAIGWSEDPDPFLSPSQVARKQRLEALLKADQGRVLKALVSLVPDRSSAGIAAYAAAFDAALAGLDERR